MKENPKKLKFPSELRLDLVSKDWVLIATGRAKRPEFFKREKKKREKHLKSKCPFCEIESQEPPTLIFSNGKEIKYEKGKKIPKNWTTVAIPNKFPALLPYSKLEKRIEGKLYQRMNAVGFCELVVTKDHYKQLAQFSTPKVKEVIDVYQERYLDLMKKPFVNYISIFHNQGVEAGASQPHPHSQIITTPLIDVDLEKALSIAERYFERKNECIYCQMNKWEKKIKTRIIFENKDFLVICPFASKSAFEIIITPKKHSPYFEKISEKEKWNLAESLRVALKKLYKGLNDPAYNFYLHTAPSDRKGHPYYHWHFTIFPKTGTWAGFEVGTRIEISTIEPERAAEYLRKQ